MTGVVVLGQALLSPPEPYVADDHADLCYAPLCACGGVETRRDALRVTRCADCGASTGPERAERLKPAGDPADD